MARNKYPEITVNRILDSANRLFLENGYEHTTIQDILDDLGDLSKGAIYHHFKSKDEIIEAVFERYYEKSNERIFSLVDEKGMTGLERLRLSLKLSLGNPDQEKLLGVVPDLLKNSRFLASQIYDSVEIVAPNLIEPLLRQGNEDGSLHVKDPREAAQLMMLMANIWLNPAVFKMSGEELDNRFHYCAYIMECMGIPGLLDEEILGYIHKYLDLMHAATS